jgi:ribosomal protein L11 methyltransferase
VRTSPAVDLSFPPDAFELIDLVTGLLDDFRPAAIQETGPDHAPAWRVFFDTPAIRDAALTTLTRACRAHGLTVTTVDVPDEDWAARSQDGLRAVRVRRIVVAPPWDVPDDLAADDRLVIIQPSMGFGTGHHETTRLCLGLLQDVDCRARQVLDVGTGSGVLALAAASMGAGSVYGIDADPDAVGNALENLALNPSLARAAMIRFDVADLRTAAGGAAGAGAVGRADIVVANLTGALIATAAPELLARASSGALLILSGFQHHEIGTVLAAFAGGAEVVAQRTEGEWASVVLAVGPRASSRARASRRD